MSIMRWHYRHLALVVLLAILVESIASVAHMDTLHRNDDTPVIHTPRGSFLGRNANMTSHFLGIRYVIRVS